MTRLLSNPIMADFNLQDNIFNTINDMPSDDEGENRRRSRLSHYLDKDESDEDEVQPRVKPKKSEKHVKIEETPEPKHTRTKKTILEDLGYDEAVYNHLETKEDCEAAFEELMIYRERYERLRPDLFHPKTGSERAAGINKVNPASIKKMKSTILRYERIMRMERLANTVKMLFEKAAGASEYILTSAGVPIGGLTDELMTNKQVNEDLALISEEYLEYLSSSPQKRLMQTVFITSLMVYNRNMERARSESKKKVTLASETMDLLGDKARVQVKPAEIVPVVAKPAEIEPIVTKLPEIAPIITKLPEIAPPLPKKADKIEFDANHPRVMEIIADFKKYNPNFTDETSILETAINAAKAEKKRR